MILQINLHSTDDITPSPILFDTETDICTSDDFDPTIGTVYLVGFVRYFSTARKEILDVDYQTFKDNIYLPLEMFPIFRNDSDDWTAIDLKVESITEL